MRGSIVIEKNITLKELLIRITIILGIIACIGLCIVALVLILFLAFKSPGVFLALFLALLISVKYIFKIIEYKKEDRYLPLKDTPDYKTSNQIYQKLVHLRMRYKNVYVDKIYHFKVNMSDIMEKLRDYDFLNQLEISYINDIFYNNRPTINLVFIKIKFMGAYKGYKPLSDEDVDMLISLKEYPKDINDEGGIYYGINQYTKNPIYYDKKKASNGHELIVGVKDIVKSYLCMEELKHIYKNTKDAIIVIQDRTEELFNQKYSYSALAESYNEKHIEASEYCTNPFKLIEINEDEFMGEHIIDRKFDFIMHFIAITVKDLSEKQKSLIYYQIKDLYENYDENNPPTISLLIERLNGIDEIKNVVRILEKKLKDGLSNFNGPNKADLSNRFTVYNMDGVKKEIYPETMLVLMESIFNATYSNMKKGIVTHIVIDNLSSKMLDNKNLDTFMAEIFKRLRMLKGIVTLVSCTRDILVACNTDVYRFISNVSTIRILRQGNDSDLDLISEYFNLPENLIIDLKIGEGILLAEGSVIPFLYSE